MEFWKLCGAGNDFVLLSHMDGAERDFPALARQLCDRHFGIGADGLIVAEPPEHGGDCKMRFFNNDGSAAEMCGNGARCICRWCRETGLSGDEQRIEATAGMVIGRRISDDRYRIALNTPHILRLHLPLDGLDCAYLELGDPGIPHAVVETDLTQDRAALFAMAKALRSHPSFPRGANVNLCEITAENEVRLLTFERGVEDFTLACGTGAGATAAALTLRGRVFGQGTRIVTDGGLLEVDVLPKEPFPELFLTGEARMICRGEVFL